MTPNAGNKCLIPSLPAGDDDAVLTLEWNRPLADNVARYVVDVMFLPANRQPVILGFQVQRDAVLVDEDNFPGKWRFAITKAMLTAPEQPCYDNGQGTTTPCGFGK